MRQVDDLDAFAPGAAQMAKPPEHRTLRAHAYAAWIDGRWLGAETLPGLLAMIARPELEPAALADLARFGAVLAPLTLYKGVWSAHPNPFHEAVQAMPGSLRLVLADPEPTASGALDVSSSDDDILRSLAQLSADLWKPYGDPSRAALAYLARTLPCDAPLLVGDPTARTKVEIDGFLAALEPKWCREAEIRGRVVQRIRGEALGLAPDRFTRARLEERYVLPELRGFYAELSAATGRSIARFEDVAASDVAMDTLVVRRPAFEVRRQDGLNLYSFAMDRLFYKTAPGSPTPFSVKPASLGPRAKRLGARADALLAPAMFAALSIDYLRRFESHSFAPEGREPHAHQA